MSEKLQNNLGCPFSQDCQVITTDKGNIVFNSDTLSIRKSRGECAYYNLPEYLDTFPTLALCTRCRRLIMGVNASL